MKLAKHMLVAQNRPQAIMEVMSVLGLRKSKNVERKKWRAGTKP